MQSTFLGAKGCCCGNAGLSGRENQIGIGPEDDILRATLGALLHELDGALEPWTLGGSILELYLLDYPGWIIVGPFDQCCNSAPLVDPQFAMLPDGAVATDEDLPVLLVRYKYCRAVWMLAQQLLEYERQPIYLVDVELTRLAPSMQRFHLLGDRPKKGL